MSDKSKPAPDQRILHVVEGSSQLQVEVSQLGSSLGYHCELYQDGPDFMARRSCHGVVLIRVRPHGGEVQGLLKQLAENAEWLPVLAYDFDPQPNQVVEAIREGALDFQSYPIDRKRLERSLDRIARRKDKLGANRTRRFEATRKVSRLSRREREVLQHLTYGKSNKVIGRDLKISPRTVEVHRANMMAKIEAKSLAEVIEVSIMSSLDN